MPIPLSQQDVPTVYVGARGFASNASAVEIPENERVQGLLTAARERLWKQQEQKAMASVKRRAAQAQTQSEELVDTPQGLAPRYQQAYEAKAETLYASQVLTEATEVREDLAQQNEFDAGGFAQGWNAYMHGQINGLVEAGVAPERITETRTALNAAGLQRQAQIEEATEARNKSMAAFEYRKGLTKFYNSATSRLYNKPDEELFHTMLDAAESQITAGVESGFLTPLQGASRVNETHNAMASSIATGTFRQALTSGDIGQARGVIRAVRGGKWFASTAQAQQTADQMASTLEARLAEVQNQRSSVANSARNQLQRYYDVAANGGQVDMEQAKDSLRTVLVYGSPEAQKQARSQFHALNSYMNVSSSIQHMAYGSVDQLIGKLDQQYAQGTYDQSEYEDIRGLLENRKGAIQTARQENDVARFLPDDPTKQDYQRIQKVTGQTPSLFSADKRSQMENTLQNATSPDEVLGVYSGVLERSQTVGMNGMTAARTIRNPRLSAGTAMLYLNPGVGTDIITAAYEGRSLSSEESQQVTISQAQFDDSKIYEVSGVVAQSDPDVRTQTVSILQNAVKGIAARMRAREGMSEDEAVEAAIGKVNNMTSAYLQNVTELSNGVSVPSGLMGETQAEIEQNTAAFNHFLENSDKVKEYRRRNATGTIHPIVDRNGNIKLRSWDTQGAMLNEEGEPITITTTQQEQSVGAVSQYPEESVFTKTAEKLFGGTKDEHAEGFEARLKMVDQVSQSTENDYPELTKAVLKATEETPFDVRGDRQPFTLLNAEYAARVHDSALYNKLYTFQWYGSLYKNIEPSEIPQGAMRDAPPPMTDSTGALIAADIILGQLVDKYGNTDKALAAYYLGPGYDHLFKGEDWESDMPGEVITFIERTKAHYDAGQ